jgi:dGTPase
MPVFEYTYSMYNRAKLEENERLTLAPYAVQSANSRGRLYPEEESAYRTVFQKDRDRVIHTGAFRRLEYKTQVFVNTEGDHYRTRLTHTLEVAQVAKTIARALGVNEDLTETIALAHDLGHPPFGHAGERILNELMASAGGFDHNVQSFRVVTKLEKRYTDWDGLNLAWETLEGMVKHETESEIAELGDFEPTWKASLEAQIANIADETAYNTHDLDDGLRSGLLSNAMLLELKVWQRFTTELGFDPRSVSEFERRVLIRELLGWVITDIINTTDSTLKRDGISSLEGVRNAKGSVVCHSDAVRLELKELKAFLYANLYRHYRKERQVHKAVYILSALFDAFIKRPSMMPDGAHSRIAIVGLERAVCDYMAGMTDRFAMDEYSRLFDPYQWT